MHPIFKKYTFDDRIKNVAKTLGFKKPAIPQSMFIYKNPKIGGEGMWYQCEIRMILLNGNKKQKNKKLNKLSFSHF